MSDPYDSSDSWSTLLCAMPEVGADSGSPGLRGLDPGAYAAGLYDVAAYAASENLVEQVLERFRPELDPGAYAAGLYDAAAYAASEFSSSRCSNGFGRSFC